MNFIAFLILSLFIIAIPPNLKAQALSEGTNLNAPSEEISQLNVPFTPAAFIDFATKGDKHVVELFLASGMNPDVEGTYGRTALESAISRPDIVRLLVEKGANVNLIRASGLPVLILAALNGYTESLKVLLDNGADIRMKDQFGNSVLNAALTSSYSNDETIKILIDRGSDINAYSPKGVPPIINALWRRRKDLIKLLLEKGADVNARDQYGTTPLIALSDSSHCNYDKPDEKDTNEILLTLLENNADFNVKDGSGQTPLIRFATNNQVQAVNTLLNHKYEEVGATDAGGATISVTIGEKTKTFYHYYGDPHAPHELSELEGKISAIYDGSNRWK